MFKAKSPKAVPEKQQRCCFTLTQMLGNKVSEHVKSAFRLQQWSFLEYEL